MQKKDNNREQIMLQIEIEYSNEKGDTSGT
jgi:hypothetical protein